MGPCKPGSQHSLSHTLLQRQIYFRVRWRDGTRFRKDTELDQNDFHRGSEGPGFQPTTGLGHRIHSEITRESPKIPPGISSSPALTVCVICPVTGARWERQCSVFVIQSQSLVQLFATPRKTYHRKRLRGWTLNPLLIHAFSTSGKPGTSSQVTSILTLEVKILQDSTPLYNCPSSIHSFKKSQKRKNPLSPNRLLYRLWNGGPETRGHIAEHWQNQGSEPWASASW